MDTKTMERVLAVLQGDETLEAEANLGRRLNAIDLLSFLHAHGGINNRNAEFAAVEARLDNFRTRLMAINTRLFDRLRTQICQGNYTHGSLRREFSQYRESDSQQVALAHFGMNALDALLDGILELRAETSFTPLPGQNIGPYVPTPAQVILDMLDSLGLEPEDVFYDVGSGLGRAVILVHLVSGVKSKGVEVDPVYYQRACEYASKLGLSQVEFINDDARNIDYGDGSVFFMYTPFTGDVVETVIDKLRRVAQSRPIRLCTYGLVSGWAAEQPWLQSEAGDYLNSSTVVIYHSRPG